MHVTLKGCVAIQFKMLTYYIYAPLLNRIDALPLNAIYNFETYSIILIFINLIRTYLNFITAHLSSGNSSDMKKGWFSANEPPMKGGQNEAL